jgi:hypothetical protein
MVGVEENKQKQGRKAGPSTALRSRMTNLWWVRRRTSESNDKCRFFDSAQDRLFDCATLRSG